MSTISNVIRSAGIAVALASCSYASEQDCLASHAACHIGTLDGDWHAGTGIDPAVAAAIFSSGMLTPHITPPYSGYDPTAGAAFIKPPINIYNNGASLSPYATLGAPGLPCYNLYGCR